MRAILILSILLCPLMLTGTEAVYDRTQVFKGWEDPDKDCFDEREDRLLWNSLIPPVLSADGCSIKEGLWYDPYYGQYFRTAQRMHLDHIVALKDAFLSGAAAWTKEQWHEFSHDPYNLWLVGASANMSKGARTPSQWLPRVMDSKCLYVVRYQRIKNKYKLTILAADKAVISNVIANCKKRQR